MKLLDWVNKAIFIRLIYSILLVNEPHLSDVKRNGGNCLKLFIIRGIYSNDKYYRIKVTFPLMVSVFSPT